MKRNKILATIILLLFSYGCCLTAFADNSTDPVRMLQTIANGMISGLKKNQATLKTKPDIVYKLAYQYVVPYADLDEMSKRVLPPQTWNNATSAQRDEFKKQFTATLIRTYASALTSYHDQTIKFYPIRGSYQNLVSVNSAIINGSGDPIRVSYQLINNGNGWRLLDMNVEGIGMLDSFRSQFADILSQATMQQLLNRLSHHNNDRG